MRLTPKRTTQHLQQGIIRMNVSRSLCCAAIALLFCSAFELRAEDSLVANWEFAGGTDGWSAENDCSLKAAGGVLTIVCTGKDPYCSAQVQAPAGWMKLTIRAKFKGRRKAQLFWMTEEQPLPAESRSVQFNMRGRTAGWNQFTTYFQTTSPLVGLRLDPHNSTGRIAIDSISLSHSSAPPADPATDPAGIRVPEGFRVELLYSVPQATQGSWVSLAFDPRDGGRLIACDQYGGLYRVTPGAVGTEDDIQVEPMAVQIGGAQGMLWAFDSLYCVLNTKQVQGPGLYRITDTDEDGHLDRVQKLTHFQCRNPGAEHGPHGIVLGPDGESLYIVGGNMTALPNGLTQPTRHQGWQEDQLLPRGPASNGHATGLLAPGGWVCRTDEHGESWELIAAGFRNPYDIAFNRDGELFTYDADMEMDIGTPWYRPTRVCHVVSGGEFGWRFGTGKWPAYFPDSLPAVVDVGLGSPTGVAFGYGAKFPPRYRDAMFINDWTNGRMFAVHMQPNGASYTGELEEFLTGAPLPLTDLVVNPADGAMYFAIGGRRTQSGLYRVTYTSDANQTAEANESGSLARQIRHELERLHATSDPQATETLWPHLASDDRHLRFAARVALEHQDVSGWAERALGETNPDAVIQSMLALARSGEKRFARQAFSKLDELQWAGLTDRQRVDLLRCYAVTFMRLGRPAALDAKRLAGRLVSHFPSGVRDVDHELCRLLVYLESPEVAAKSVPLMSAARTQEDRLFYGMTLRTLKSGWTHELRQEYFEQLNACEIAAAVGDYIGGGHFQLYTQMCRKDAAELMSDAERRSLDEVINAEIRAATTTGSPTPRKFIRNWTTADLLPELDRVGEDRSFENGKAMFRTANCVHCHRFNNTGGIFGPDITKAAQRYSRQVLLREMLQPSKQVSDQYQAHTIITDSGKVYSGRILNEDESTLTMATDPLKPAHVVEIPNDEIEERFPAKTSLMPTGLLNTLTKEDILDLLAYIESAGDSGHPIFTPAESQ